MHKDRTIFRIGSLLFFSTIGSQAIGAESGAGLYVPGTNAFGAGVTPPDGLYVTQAVMFYDGRAEAVVDGGSVDLNARKTAAPLIASVMCVPEQEILDGRVGLTLSVPYASYTRLQAGSNALGQNVETSGWGMGDISLKAQIGWSTDTGFSHTVSTTLWLPTGRYDLGFSPNAGKNHSGINLSWGFTQKWKEPGIELSGSVGLTRESRNDATDYHNGTAASAEAAIGKIFDNGLTLGAAGFAYRQIEGDSGSGATLGPMRGRAFGLGPALSYAKMLGGRPYSLAFRHYREFGVENRFDGHLTMASLTARF